MRVVESFLRSVLMRAPPSGLLRTPRQNSVSDVSWWQARMKQSVVHYTITTTHNPCSGVLSLSRLFPVYN